MLLLSDGIGFTNPRRKLPIEICQTVESKRVQMISRREGFDAGKARMLNPARKNKVSDEIVSAQLHRNE